MNRQKLTKLSIIRDIKETKSIPSFNFTSISLRSSGQKIVPLSLQRYKEI